MATFNDLQPTTDGLRLVAKSQDGRPPTFTAIVLGDGISDVDASLMPGLVHECIRLPLTNRRIVDAGVYLSAQLKMGDVSEGFVWRELGVIAQDPDDGSEKLYVYGYDAAGGSIPGAGDKTKLDMVIEVLAKFYGMTDFKVLLDTSLIYLTQAELDAHNVSPDAHWVQMSQKADLGLDGKVIPEQLPGLDYEPLGAVTAHNVSPDAHTALFAAVNARLATAEAEIAGIRHNLYDPITGNPHTYTFDSLTGIRVVSGCWNKPQTRLEC